ncbi:MAG: hypothetical protein HN849_11905 [Victivallales bacterium]|mgnify:CR=1 FL=1|jgi:hypothetical protein|nr:hypothetical protein [Victivallales bacterium]MBT7300214.1 hypothetical protein [Victivallales bacterium]
MERIELYKNLKQAKLDEDRKKLLASIDHLLQEAELVKSQIEAGHAWETNLANRGRQVDDLAASVQNTMGTIALLETIQSDEE